MRNDLTIYDKVADRWWSDDIRWVRTLKNLVPGRLQWFDRHIDWQGKAVLDLGCAGGPTQPHIGHRAVGLDVGLDNGHPVQQRRHAAFVNPHRVGDIQMLGGVALVGQLGIGIAGLRRGGQR